MGYDITHIKGNTLEQILFECKINNTPIDLTNATITMSLYRNPYSSESPALTLTSVANNGITITDPLLGKFKINEQIINISAYNYYYEIKFVLSSGDVKTYINGNFIVNSI